MLKIKIFQSDDEEGINMFLDTTVPAEVVVRDQRVTIVYDDHAPMNNIQKKNAIRAQIAKQTEKVMNASINVDLSGISVKDIPDNMPKEMKERIRMAHTNNKDTLDDERASLEALERLYDSLSK